LQPKGAHPLRLHAGVYELALGEGAQGLRLSAESVTLQRGDRKVVTVRPASRPEPAQGVKVGEVRLFEKQHSGRVNCVAVAADGQRALSCGMDGTVRLWDVGSGKELHLLGRHEGVAWGVAFSPGGRHALSSGNDATLRLWDLETKTESQPFRGHTERTLGVAFSPDGLRALSSSGDRNRGQDLSVRVWDVASGQELR